LKNKVGDERERSVIVRGVEIRRKLEKPIWGGRRRWFILGTEKVRVCHSASHLRAVKREKSFINQG